MQYGSVRNLGIVEMMKYENNIFKDVSISYYIIEAFTSKKNCKGPDLMKTLEAPEIIQKVLESIRNHYLAIWE